MTAVAVPAVKEADTRVGRLRDRIINAPQEVCIERARFLTRSMSKHWSENPHTRIGLALEHILNNITVTIRDEELIVGCRTSKLKGAPLFPENKSRWIQGDVDNFDLRVVQRALITEEEKRELREEILPFWDGRTVEERFEALLPEDVADDMDKYIFTMMLEITYGIGHFTMNHERILGQGLTGLMAEAERALAGLKTEDPKAAFYRAVIRSLKAAIHFAHRYADLAQNMASREPDASRREELKRIAAVCRRVPEHPPETFHEAVQAMYFIHLVTQIESGGNSVSLGRVDQNLYPYYKRDLERGLITPDEARELISLLYLKVNEIWNVLEEAFIPGGEGTEGKTTQNVTVGGVDIHGADAVNDLSFIALDAYADIRTVQPNFGVRVGGRTDPDFMLRAAAYARDGVLLHFFNDDAVVESLTRAGHSLEDARNYGVVGCLEPNAQGKSFGSTFAIQFNGIKCLEFALSDGIDNIFGYQSGLNTGDPAGFKSFDDVWRAYDRQMTHYLGQVVKGIGCLDRAIAEMAPSPFASAMIDGPLERGMDLTGGGAQYNSTGIQLMGFSNIADSLYAVNKVVFEDKKYTLEDLALWLSEDWMDAEDKQSHLKFKVDKYGNDRDDVDGMAARVMNHFADAVSGFSNYRGGAFWPGIFSVGFHLAMGAFTGATPDGRSAGEVLGNGITPSNATALSGPTAILNSVTKLPLYRVPNGLNLNMRFSGRAVSDENLSALIAAYFRRGGVQVQFNMVDSETLQEAREKPAEHRDLIVRISGYSGIFVDLSEIAQDEIIERTKFEL